MLSCDTIALCKERYFEKQNILAKNSDRPLGEAQPLVFFPAENHPEGAMLSCTHLTIPQAAHTYAMLGSKPYWIWGFEMGANEKGLFIGNEAQGSRCAAESEEGMLGMDMLRIALERCASAREAIEVIAELLTRYGQNANANMRYDRRYENSFMLVDRDEVWVMETAGREWAAKRANDSACISNCYTIETEYDLCSTNMEALAREKRWIGPHEPMNFAKAYTLPAPRQSHSVPRRRQLQMLVAQHEDELDLYNVRDIFRNHFEGTILSPRYGQGYANFVSICMHAQTENDAQTAASAIFVWDDVLGVKTRYAPSIPCCSVYIPVYWTGKVPEAMASGGRWYDDNALWWRAEKLAMAISIDEERFGAKARKALCKLEDAIDTSAKEAEKQAKELIAGGKKEVAFDLLAELTEKAVADFMAVAKRLSDEICSQVKEDGGLYGQRKEFLEDYCEWAKMEL